MANEPESGQHRILLVDDHPVFCLGMTELINKEKDLNVVGSEESAVRTIDAIDRLSPGLVIVDISLKDGDGIELVGEINRLRPDVRVLVVSMYDESLYAERALMAGAQGYVMKQNSISVVVTAIRQVLAGGIYASQEIKERVFSRFFAGKQVQTGKSAIERLTNRELEVFRLIGNGYSTKEIAGRMRLSPKTVGTYRENIKQKLDLKHYTELVQYAVHWHNKMRI